MKFLILIGLLVTALSSPLRPSDIKVINFLRRNFGLNIKPVNNEDSAVSSSFRSDSYIGRGNTDCPPGLLRNVFRECVEPIIEQKVFVYSSPETKWNKPAVSVQALPPRNNILVVNQLDENERRNNALFFRPPQIEEVFGNQKDRQFKTLQDIANFQRTRGTSKKEEHDEPRFLIALNNNGNPESNVIQLPDDIIEDSAQFLSLDDVQGLTPVVIPLETLDAPSQRNIALLGQRYFRQGGQGRQDGSGGVNLSSALNSLRRRNKSGKERYAKLSPLARGANFGRPVETGRLLSNSGANQHPDLFNRGYAGFGSSLVPSVSYLDFTANNIGHPILHQRGAFLSQIPNFSGFNAHGVGSQGNQRFGFGYNSNIGAYNGRFGNAFGSNPTHLGFSTGNFQNGLNPLLNSNLERNRLRNIGLSNGLAQGGIHSPNSIGLPSRSFSNDASEETPDLQSKSAELDADDQGSQSVSSQQTSGTQDIQDIQDVEDTDVQESSSARAFNSYTLLTTEPSKTDQSNINTGEEQSSSKNDLSTGTERSYSDGESGLNSETTEKSKIKTTLSSNILNSHKDSQAEESQSNFESQFAKEEISTFEGEEDKSTDTSFGSDLPEYASQGNSIFFSSKIGEIADDGFSSSVAPSEVTSTLENKSSSQIYSNNIDSKTKDSSSFIKINISSIKDFPVVFVRFNDEKKPNKY